MKYNLLRTRGALQEGAAGSGPPDRGVSVIDLLALGEVLSGPSVAEQGTVYNLERRVIPQVLIEFLPESVARESCIIPIESDGERLVIAAADRGDIALADKLRFFCGTDVKLVSAPREAIAAAINRHYGECETESVDSMLAEFTETAISTWPDIPEPAHPPQTRDARRPILPAGFAKTLAPGPAAAPRTISRSARLQTKGEGMLYYVVPEGERALLGHVNGRFEEVIGPRRGWLGRKTVLPLERHVAHPGEVLIIRYLNGNQEHVVGPAEVWEYPRQHASIARQDCLQLAAKEAVVVYRHEQGDPADKSTSRRIVYGPTLFFPQPGEWLHTFSWHASKGGSRGVEKTPNGLVFQKLWLMPDQMYHDANDVRTADGAVLTIRLMIFFELVDIERMLDNTHDPIGDFVNAATADVVDFVGKLDFDAFKSQTHKLNEVPTYTQLTDRASQSGYRITNVVYRGYGAAESLQKMHNQAIEARTKLQLDRETEQQAQQLEDFKLQSQLARTGERRAEQLNETRHMRELSRENAVAELELRRQQGEFRRQQRLDDARTQEEASRIVHASEENHWRVLAEMGVDLTRYLTQARADRIIEFRNSAPVSPQVHLNGDGEKDFAGEG